MSESSVNAWEEQYIFLQAQKEAMTEYVMEASSGVICLILETENAASTSGEQVPISLLQRTYVRNKSAAYIQNQKELCQTGFINPINSILLLV